MGWNNLNRATTARSGKNGVLNGEFRLCHENTTVGAAGGGGTVADLLFADYWYYVYNGAMGITYTQSTDAPTVAQAGRVIPYSLRATVTTPDTSIASGDYCSIVQRIPGDVWSYYAQKACNMSFWVRSSVTGNYAVTITDNLDSYSCVGVYTINAANTWEFKSISFPASPSAGTWDYTSTFGYGPYGHQNQGGVILNFCFAAGSTYQTGTTGSWQNASYFHTTSSPANAVATTNNIFAITSVQLEVGSGFSGYEVVEPQLEVLRAAHSATAGGLLTTLGRPRKNFIINGDMDVWQRNTSFASISSAYTADRWLYGMNSDATTTIAQSTDCPSFAISGRVFNYSLRHTISVADTSIAAGQYATINQKIEGYLWRYLSQRDFTISFWVRGTVTGTYCVAVQSPDSSRTIALEYTISTTNTWEFKTVYVPASPSAGNWGYTNGAGAVMVWTLAAGSTYNQGTGQWVSANYVATSNQVNALSSTSNIFAITGVQAELGTGFSGYETRSFQEESLLCERYFRKSNPYTSAITNNNTVDIFPVQTTSIANGEYYATVKYPFHMRAAPTVTTYPYTTASNTGRGSNDVGTDFAANSANVGSSQESYFAVRNNSGGALTIGSQKFVFFGWYADAEL